MMKKILLISICLFFFLPSINAEPLDLAPQAKSAILMEASTGTILYQKDIHVKYAPASMTKVMSMLLIIEAIENGNLKWNEKLKISPNAAGMGGSQIFLEAGEVMSVEDLFKGIAIGSANDATVALAERVGGTEEHFVKLMNEKAIELGLKNTNFKNSSGLDEANHYSTAYDMAIMARQLVQYPSILKYTAIYEDYLRQDRTDKFWLVNTNKLVRFYSGVDGLKTGYTSEAGYCLTATAKRNNMRLIAVVYGAPDSSVRNNHISKMLDYGFNVYEVEKLLSSESVIGRIEVIKGKDKYMDIVPKEDVNILHRKGETKKNVTYKIEITNQRAPLAKGDIVGMIHVNEDGKIIRSVGITVKQDVSKANIFQLYLRYLLDIIKGDINLKIK
jgi:serine-type D-Ala-D-Ala carboxypeptidase (penicillin-binding protein 5/6)